MIDSSYNIKTKNCVNFNRNAKLMKMMETKSFKASICEALGTLSLDQVDQVMSYIKVLQNSSKPDSSYLQFKQNAMEQIAEALKKEKSEEKFKLQLV